MTCCDSENCHLGTFWTFTRFALLSAGLGLSVGFFLFFFGPCLCGVLLSNISRSWVRLNSTCSLYSHSAGCLVMSAWHHVLVFNLYILSCQSLWTWLVYCGHRCPNKAITALVYHMNILFMMCDLLVWMTLILIILYILFY